MLDFDYDLRCVAYYFKTFFAVRLWIFPENFVDGPEEITYFSDKTLEVSDLQLNGNDARVTFESMAAN